LPARFPSGRTRTPDWFRGRRKPPSATKKVLARIIAWLSVPVSIVCGMRLEGSHAARSFAWRSLLHPTRAASVGVQAIHATYDATIGDTTARRQEKGRTLSGPPFRLLSPWTSQRLVADAQECKSISVRRAPARRGQGERGTRAGEERNYCARMRHVVTEALVRRR
jgi:hypothetical protein